MNYEKTAQTENLRLVAHSGDCSNARIGHPARNTVRGKPPVDMGTHHSWPHFSCIDTVASLSAFPVARLAQAVVETKVVKHKMADNHRNPHSRYCHNRHYRLDCLSHPL